MENYDDYDDYGDSLYEQDRAVFSYFEEYERLEILRDIVVNDVDIDTYIEELVDKMSVIAEEVNGYYKVFGCNHDETINDIPLTFNGETFELEIEPEPLQWHFFMPDYIKIYYGRTKEDGTMQEPGLHYYIDDNEYLKDFARYLKNTLTEDEIYELTDKDFIYHVFNFLNSYFESLTTKEHDDRVSMHTYLVDSNEKSISTRKHSNKDFYGRNNAECSEYSSMGLNILGAFGYNASIVYGMESDEDGLEGHMYNIVNLDGELYLVDFSMSTYCTDMKTDRYCKVPYIAKITRKDYDALFTEQIIELENYELLKLGNTIVKDNIGIRKYSIGGELVIEKTK